MEPRITIHLPNLPFSMPVVNDIYQFMTYLQKINIEKVLPTDGGVKAIRSGLTITDHLEFGIPGKLRRQRNRSYQETTDKTCY